MYACGGSIVKKLKHRDNECLSHTRLQSSSIVFSTAASDDLLFTQPLPLSSVNYNSSPNLHTSCLLRGHCICPSLTGSLVDPIKIITGNLMLLFILSMSGSELLYAWLYNSKIKKKRTIQHEKLFLSDLNLNK